MNVLPNQKQEIHKWYTELLKHADLCENFAVRGSMIIKPYGYAIWEKIKEWLDKALKKAGNTNMYFPLLIPKSAFNKENEHMAGFAKECAVVTHYRLKSDLKKKKILVDETAKLEEELIIRPTSETIIWEYFKKQIESYKNLPLCVNQWCNVIRWEMRTKPFLRSTEILWQEGHTAHINQLEAQNTITKILTIYRSLLEDLMCIPTLQGIKTSRETFAGADTTHTLEVLLQDQKALQVATVHFLAQKFSEAFDVKFVNEQGQLLYPWGTSWGVSTRLIGSLIMVHGDEKGLVLPTKLAPIQVVIIPIYTNDLQKVAVQSKAEAIQNILLAEDISVKFDTVDYHTPGYKFHEYELKGVPIRLAIGPRDLKNNTIELYRRDTQQKQTISLENLVSTIQQLFVEIEQHLYQKALKFQEEYTTHVITYDELKEVIQQKGGFVKGYWSGSTLDEKKIQQETKATIRCILPNNNEPGKCIYTQKETKQCVVFAKSY